MCTTEMNNALDRYTKAKHYVDLIDKEINYIQLMSNELNESYKQVEQERLPISI